MFVTILKRIIRFLFNVFIIVTLTFIITRLTPGTPFVTLEDISQTLVSDLIKFYGFDLSILDQYIIYIKNLLSGNLGVLYTSTIWNTSDIITENLPFSIKMGFLTLLLSLTIGLPLGIIAAIYRNTWVDSIASCGILIGYAIPNIVLGPLVIWVFAIYIPIFSVGGWGNGTIYDITLPIIVMATPGIALYGKMIRHSMINALEQPYILYAKAKGADAKRVILHAILPALTPIITNMGMSIAGLLTGSMIVEISFSLPGIGQHIVDATLNREYNLVLATVIVYSILLMIGNTIADVTHILINPKLRKNKVLQA